MAHRPSCSRRTVASPLVTGSLSKLRRPARARISAARRTDALRTAVPWHHAGCGGAPDGDRARAPTHDTMGTFILLNGAAALAALGVAARLGLHGQARALGLGTLTG